MKRSHQPHSPPLRPVVAPGTASVASPLPPRRRRWLLLGAGLLVFAVVAGWWWGNPRPSVDLSIPADIGDPELRSAIEKARIQVELQPDSAEAWGKLGMTLQANGYAAEANRFFDEAHRLAPDDARWPYYQALAAISEDAEAALRFLRQAAAGHLANSEHESAILLRFAEALLERKELIEAEKAFQDEWQRHPGEPRAAFGLGLIAQARGQAVVAEKFFNTARTSPTVRKTATAQLAALARARRDFTRAAAWEQESAALPNEVPPWPDPLLSELQRYRTSSRVAAQTPQQLEAQHRFADAAKAYAQLLQQQPTPRNYVGAGLNAVLSGQSERGLSYLREAIRIDPQQSESHFALAQALYQLAATERERSPNSSAGRDLFLEAADSARRATELRPDHAQAFLVWGQALSGRGDWVAAVSPLRKAVAVRPELAALQLALGEALLETSQFQEAETHLNNARKLDPRDERLESLLRRLQQNKR